MLVVVLVAVLNCFFLFQVNAFSATFISSRKASSIFMSIDENFSPSTGKRNVFGGIATLLTVAAISSSSLPITVVAANYGGFGSNYAEVIDPKTAVVNDETYKTDDVKAGLDGLLNLVKIVGSLKESLSKDSQADILTVVEKDLSPGKMRSILNQYNNAFSEDTQRGTDRLIRNVIQDVNELGREAALKPGKQRSAAKLATTFKRLTAAEDALKELAAFYPK